MKIRLILDRITGKAIMAGDKAVAVRSTDALNIQQTSELSQADYDALATKDTTTLYLITGTSGYVKAYIGDSPLYREPEPRTISGTSAIVFSSIDGGRIKSLVRYGKCEQGSVPCVTAITQLGKCVQAYTPTPSAPVDIVCNNGALRYGALGSNLYDPSTAVFTVGYYYNPSNQGAETAISNNFVYHSYIPIEAGEAYVFYGRRKTGNSLSQYNRIHWYDAEKTYISTSTYTGGTIGKGVAPNNAVYARLSCNPLGTTAAITEGTVLGYNWTFCKGTAEVTPFVPFVGGIYTDGTPEVLTVRGKNLYNKADGVIKGYPSATGTWNGRSGDTSELSIIVTLEEGKTYTAQRASGGNCAFRAMGSANRPLEQGQSLLVISSPTTITNDVTTFTVPSGYPHIVFYVRNNAGTSLTINDVVNAFQVELGDQSTAYEPYVAPQTVNDIPMLLGVGNYKDEAEIISGLLTHKVGVFVSDGTANWMESATPNGFTVSVPGKLQSRTAVIKSTHFKYDVNTLLNIPDGCVMSFGTTSIGIKDTRFSTVEALNAEHAAHPVIFIYPLATETTESTTAHPELTNQKYTSASAEGSVDDITVTVTRGVTSTPTPYNPIPVMCNNGEVTGQGATGTPEVLTLSAAGETDQTATVVDLLQVGDVKDEQDVITGEVARRCAACLYDGTQQVGDDYISSTGGKDIGAVIVYPLAAETTNQVTPQPLICHMGSNTVESVCNVSDPVIKVIYPE